MATENIYKKINGLSNSSSCKVLQTFDLRKIHNRPLYQGPFKCKIPDLELLPNKVIRENKFPQHKRIMTANSNLNLPKQKTGFRSAIKSRPLIKKNQSNFSLKNFGKTSSFVGFNMSGESTINGNISKCDKRLLWSPERKLMGLQTINLSKATNIYHSRNTQSEFVSYTHRRPPMGDKLKWDQTVGNQTETNTELPVENGFKRELMSTHTSSLIHLKDSKCLERSKTDSTYKRPQSTRLLYRPVPMKNYKESIFEKRMVFSFREILDEFSFKRMEGIDLSNPKTISPKKFYKVRQIKSGGIRTRRISNSGLPKSKSPKLIKPLKREKLFNKEVKNKENNVSREENGQHISASAEKDVISERPATVAVASTYFAYQNKIQKEMLPENSDDSIPPPPALQREPEKEEDKLAKNSKILEKTENVSTRVITLKDDCINAEDESDKLDNSGETYEIVNIDIQTNESQRNNHITDTQPIEESIKDNFGSESGGNFSVGNIFINNEISDFGELCPQIEKLSPATPKSILQLADKDKENIKEYANRVVETSHPIEKSIFPSLKERKEPLLITPVVSETYKSSSKYGSEDQYSDDFEEYESYNRGRTEINLNEFKI